MQLSTKQNSDYPAMKKEEQITLEEDFQASRLDQAMSKSFADYSRSQCQHFIKSKQVTVNCEEITQAKYKVKAGDTIAFTVTGIHEERWVAENIPLQIEYEDDDLIIINKPRAMVVHPGAGVYEGTLVNALLYYDQTLETLPRAGLIHRLDKDTTGLLLIAKTNSAYLNLSEQMRERTIKRTYEAIIQGRLISGGTIDAPIGRHPTTRIKMAVRPNGGREARTHYRVIERFQYHTHCRVHLETGRTHQIRVHMAHIKHPIIGDATYNRLAMPADATEELKNTLKSFVHQALHATELSLTQPNTGELITCNTPPPDDFNALITALQNNESHYT